MMATESDELVHSQVREVISRLQAPVLDLPVLLALLASPLDNVHLCLPAYVRHIADPLPVGAINISKHFPPLQRAILEQVLPAWDSALTDHQAYPLIEQYFCPNPFSSAGRAAGEVAVVAYSTLLSTPFTEHAIRILARLAREYPIDRLHTHVFSLPASPPGKRTIIWEDCVRNVAAVPTKVSNTLQGKNVPEALQHAAYFDHVSRRCEVLMHSLSAEPSIEEVATVCYLLTRLVNLGVFPTSPPTARSQPSFFRATLETIRRRLTSDDSTSYSAFWSDVLASLPSIFTMQAILTSLVASLLDLSPPLGPSPIQRARVKGEAALLLHLVGPLLVEKTDLWECFSAVVLSRDWSESRARVFVCWVAGAGVGPVDENALEDLLSKTVEIWANPEHVKHSLFNRHRYLTSLLLVTTSYFRPNARALLSLALSPTFITGVGHYVSHPDRSIRRCGMLVAEVVAGLVRKKLDFGDWDGDDEAKPWARDMRTLIATRDADAPSDAGEPVGSATDTSAAPTPVIAPTVPPPTQPRRAVVTGTSGDDSDDSLTGYASPSSSRPPSPTQSELDEIEKEPTLHIGDKKIPRPVYLVQLAALVSGMPSVQPGEDTQEPDRIQMALNDAAQLIRKKCGFGTELEETAVELVYRFAGLQDNFELDGFESKRQGALNALVACCPRKAAPAIIEEFFKNQYSMSQRYAMLNALVSGARELSSLTDPSSASQAKRATFPSKILPPKLHQKYIAAQEQRSGMVQGFLENISRATIENARETNAHKEPQLVRERRLRIRPPNKVTEILANEVTAFGLQNVPPAKTTFNEVAAEFFIAPLINRFWLFLRDEQVREERTVYHEALHRYRGAGTGLILNPMMLQHFLGALAILMHTSRNAPEWLAILAPDALELAVTMGTRPVSRGNIDADDDEGGVLEPKDQEASVLTTALELALVVLNGSLELDGGRSLGLDHTALLIGTGEWAGQIFSRLEQGTLIQGGGGALEGRSKTAAAAVLLKVDEATSKWRMSMVDFRQ